MSIEKRLRRQVPLNAYNSFRLGGPAQYFLELSQQSELLEALEWAEGRLPVFVLGGGSNLLIADQGFEGLVLKLANRQVERRGERLLAGAGAPLANLLGQALLAGLSGLEWAAGIPGSVGGAIRGNAGAYGGEMKDNVLSVEVYDRLERQWRRLSAADCGWGYRHSRFKEQPELIVWSAEFKLQPADSRAIKDRMLEILTQRKAKLPTEPSPGCMFKNLLAEKLPVEAEQLKSLCRYGKLPAGQLIELLGAKQWRRGQIAVSQRHANFIVNQGGGSATEVLALVRLIQAAARQQYGLELDTEVEMLGF